MRRLASSGHVAVERGFVGESEQRSVNMATAVGLVFAENHFDDLVGPDPGAVGCEVRLFRRQSHQGYRFRHHHPEGQLFLLDAGSCEVACGSERWIVRPGQPCWLPPHAPHEVSALGAIAGRSILIAERLCGAMPRKSAVLPIADLFTPVLERLTAVDVGSARAERLLLVLLDELTSLGCDGPVLRLPHHPRLRRFALGLAAAPEDGRGIEECARSVAMSARSFSRHFVSGTGLSFVRWRCFARAIRAAELIRHGTSATQAGLQVGYESQSTFSSSFRKWMGMTPTEYRKSPASTLHRIVGGSVGDAEGEGLGSYLSRGNMKARPELGMPILS